MKLSQQAGQNIDVAKQLVGCFVLNYSCDDESGGSVLNTVNSCAEPNSNYVAIRRATVFAALTHLDKSVRLLLEVFGEDIAKRIEPLSVFFSSHAHYHLDLSVCIYRLKSLLEANEADHSFLFSFLVSKNDPHSFISSLSSMSVSTTYSVKEWEARQDKALMSVGSGIGGTVDVGDTSLSEEEKANLIVSHMESTQKVPEEPSSALKHWTQCEPTVLLSMCDDLRQTLDDFRAICSEY